MMRFCAGMHNSVNLSTCGSAIPHVRAMGPLGTEGDRPGPWRYTSIDHPPQYGKANYRRWQKNIHRIECTRGGHMNPMRAIGPMGTVSDRRGGAVYKHRPPSVGQDHVPLLAEKIIA